MVVRRRHVEHVVGVTSWNDQQVAGIDVLQRKDRNVLGIFKYDPLRDAAGDDLAENARARWEHGA